MMPTESRFANTRFWSHALGWRNTGDRHAAAYPFVPGRLVQRGRNVRISEIQGQPATLGHRRIGRQSEADSVTRYKRLAMLRPYAYVDSVRSAKISIKIEVQIQGES